LVRKDLNAQLQLRGKKILLNGTPVATVTGGTHGQKLRIQFNPNATAADVNMILQHVVARTTKHSSDGVRTIRIEIDADNVTATGTINALKG
jgi:hypothetical protein